MVVHWSLSDSKSRQVSRTLLSILAVLNNVIVWTVSTPPPTSKSFSPFRNPLVTIPNSPITISIIVTCMFYRFFFNSLASSRYLSFLSQCFSGQPGQKNRQFCNFSFFGWIILGLIFWLRLGDLCVCQSPIGAYVCHFLGQLLVCAYTTCSYGQI